MIRIYFITWLITSLFVVSQSKAQNSEKGHKLSFVINGMPDTTFLLAYYFDESIHTLNTARSDSRGRFSFEGDAPLSKGVYILVLESNKTKYFDFVVYEDQHFTLKTSIKDLIRDMDASDDLNNRLYFENMLFNAKHNKRAQPWSTIIKDSLKSEKEKNEARKKLEEINDEVVAYQLALIKTHPNSLVSKILNGHRRVEIPTPPEDMSDVEKNRFRYEYYKKHFWDYFDLNDDAMIRLPFPLYRQKTDEYFDKVVMQHPDSIIKEISLLAEKAKHNPETYQFLVLSLSSKYYAPEIMGLDKVFVHLYDEYFKSGEMDFWANDQLKTNFKDRADKLRLSFIGMRAPNLIMQDARLQPRSLYDITNKYTVIYFYDPDCGHCKEETPVLVNFFNEARYDLQVYSVCADTSLTKMKDYIKDMSMEKWVNVNGPRSYVGHYQELYDAFQTPTLYLIDDKKKIIAKKLPSEKLDDFLSRYEAIEKRDTK